MNAKTYFTSNADFSSDVNPEDVARKVKFSLNRLLNVIRDKPQLQKDFAAAEISMEKIRMIFEKLGLADDEKIALGDFIERFRYQSDPYANIGTFVETIKENTPDDLKYLVSDTFEKITLYENKAKEANAIENEDGTYEVTFTVEAKKVYSDSVGTQTTAVIND